MGKMIDVYIKQNIEENIKIRVFLAISRIALKMLEKGLDLNFVSSVTDMSPDDLLKLQKSRGKRINQG